LARFPPPPPADELAGVAPIWHDLPTGTLLWRVYFRGGVHPTTWNAFRIYGPTGARFDHHTRPRREQPRAIYYAALSGRTCLAEVFQQTRVIDVSADAPALAAFRLGRDVRLLDLRGLWPMRAGASQALSTGSHARARAWSRVIWSAYPEADGLWYASPMDGGAPAVALYERAEDAVPSAPVFSAALAEPGLRVMLARAAAELNYVLLVP
jgi:hypothetical protein